MRQYIPYFQGLSASISASAFASAASTVGTFAVGTLIVETFVGEPVVGISNSFVRRDSVEPRGACRAVRGRAGGRALCPWNDAGADTDMVSNAFGAC